MEAIYGSSDQNRDTWDEQTQQVGRGFLFILTKPEMAV